MACGLETRAKRVGLLGLQALGQQSLVDPLNQMLGEALAFVPNLVAAAILFFIGRVVASVVREVVTNFLGAAGIDRISERIGLARVVEGRKASQMIGTLVHLLVLVPVLVASVDALGIEAIADPVKSTLTQIVAIIPLLIVASILGVVGYAIAKALGSLMESTLHGLGADSLPQRFGLNFLQPKEGQMAVSQIGGTIVTFVVLLYVAQQALATVGLSAFAGLVESLVGYLPDLASALAIVLVAMGLSGYLGTLLSRSMEGHEQAKLVSLLVRSLVLFVGFGIGLSQLGVGENVVSIATASALGGIGLGIGIALGLGAKDKAKEWVDKAVS